MTVAGERVGPYELIGLLGAGGMGEVWRARDPRLSRDVALKLLPAALKGDTDRLRRFEQEARATGALNHPNVLVVYDVGADGGVPYLVSELLEGETLRERLERGPLPARKAIELAAQIAHGLAAAHDKGIVHRDLKPGNLFVTTDGRAKILDFGLAKVTPAGDVSGPTLSEGTAAGAVMGSIGYMAPEQVRGQPADARSDIFALGAVLYEMLTGAKAFAGETPVEIGYATLNHDPPEPHASLGLQRVVRRCLEKAPGERFQSAHDLAFTLEALEGDSGPVRPAATAAATTRRVAVTLLALAVAGAVGVAGGWLGRGRASPPQSRRGSARTTQTSSRPAVVRHLKRLTREQGVEHWPMLAPDGSWFVYQGEVESHTDIFRQRVGGDVATNLTAGCTDDDMHAAISPDGQRIAFRSDRDGGGIYLMGATGESVRRLTNFGFHPAWSPDGRSIAVSSARADVGHRRPDGEVYVVDATTGAKQLVDTGEDAIMPVFSPDGRWIAYVNQWNNVHVAAIREKGAALHLVDNPDGVNVWAPTWAPDGRSIYFSSDISGPWNLWRVGVDAASSRARDEPEPVTVAPSITERPSFSIDGRGMLFVAFNPRYNILRAPFDSRSGRLSGAPQRLTRGANLYSAPDVSPDGEWVTFASSKDADTADVCLMRSDGTGIRALTDGPGLKFNPRFSFDGRHIFFQWCGRGETCQVYRIAIDGSGLTRLASRSEHSAFPAPSPVDSRVAVWMFGDNSDLVFDGNRALSEQQPVRIAAPPERGLEFVPMRWTADASEIVGWLRDESQATRAIVAYSLGRRTYRDIVRGDTDLDAVPLRDGHRMVVERADKFWLLDVPSGRQELLLSLEPELTSIQFSISRDERWIYFATVDDDGDLWLAELQ